MKRSQKSIRSYFQLESGNQPVNNVDTVDLDDDGLELVEITDSEDNADSQVSQTSESNDGSPGSKKSKRNLSVVWQHYKKLPKEEQVNGKSWQCIYCSKLYSEKTATGTLKSHLAKSCVQAPEHLKNKHEEKYIANSSGQVTKGEKLKIQHALISFIVNEALPHNTVDSKYFQAFVSSLRSGYKLPCRQTAKKIICSDFESARKNLLKYFATELDSKIGISFDLWTSSQNIPYIVITCHWIDKNWVMQSCILDFLCLAYPHTATHFQSALLKCLNEFGLEQKLLGIASDNEAAAVLASELLRETWQKDHLLDTVHIRCGAHCLNLTVKLFLNFVASTFSQVRNVATLSKNSPKFCEALQEACESLRINYKKLQLDTPTRWSSTFDMLNRAYYLREPINFVASRSSENLNWKDYGEYFIEQDTWQKVKAATTFLEPFYQATNDLSSSTSYPSISTLWVLLDTLHEHLTSEVFSASASSQAFQNELKIVAQSMLSDLESRRDQIDNSNNLTRIAVLLDPRTKDKLFAEEEQALVQDEAKSYLRKFYPLSAEQLSKQAQNSVEAAQKSKSLFNFRLKNLDDNLDDEIDHYLKRSIEPFETNILQWWKGQQETYPRLSRMAKDILSLPATSVPSEQAFSKAGDLITKKRNRLNPGSIRASMCLQSWQKLL